MEFTEALFYLKSGKIIKRKNSSCRYFFRDNTIMSILDCPHCSNIFSSEDILANDWETGLDFY